MTGAATRQPASTSYAAIQPVVRTPRVVFLAGHRSRYGAAHLEPIREAFDLAAVVLATDDRWARFSQSLTGRTLEASRPGNRRTGLRSVVRAAIPPSILMRRAARMGRPPAADDVCRRYHIPTLRTDDANDAETRKWISAHNPDLIISAAFPQILSRPLLELAPLGAINFHPSLLPQFRGAHPHYWAIATGMQTSGVTAHFMTEAIDQGNIVCQRPFPIAELNYTQCYDRIVDETAPLVADVADFFRSGGGSGIPQNDDDATYFRNDREHHHRVNWNTHSSAEICNLVRTERAWTQLNDDRIAVKGALPTDAYDCSSDLSSPILPGTILHAASSATHQLYVQAHDGVLSITTTAPIKVHVGDRFDSPE